MLKSISNGARVISLAFFLFLCNINIYAQFDKLGKTKFIIQPNLVLSQSEISKGNGYSIRQGVTYSFQIGILHELLTKQKWSIYSGAYLGMWPMGNIQFEVDKENLQEFEFAEDLEISSGQDLVIPCLRIPITIERKIRFKKVQGSIHTGIDYLYMPVGSGSYYVEMANPTKQLFLTEFENSSGPHYLQSRLGFGYYLPVTFGQFYFGLEYNKLFGKDLFYSTYKIQNLYTDPDTQGTYTTGGDYLSFNIMFTPLSRASRNLRKSQKTKP